MEEQIEAFKKQQAASQARGDILTKLGGWVFIGFGVLIMTIGVVLVFDDPEGFFAIAFGAVFVGIGYAVMRIFGDSHSIRSLAPKNQRSVPVWEYSYEAPQELGSARTRSRSISIYVDEYASEDDIEAARQRWWQDLLKRRPDWVAGRIAERDADLRSQGIGVAVTVNVVIWGMALACTTWLGVSWFFFIIPILVGLAAIVYVVRAHLRHRKFGSSYLALDSVPAYLGGRLIGTVETGVASRDSPLEGFTVRVLCQDHYESGRGDKRKSQVATLWETEQTIHGTRAPRQPRVLAVPIDVPLPVDLPPTSTISKKGIRWTVAVEADLPGLDYGAHFEIPVFPVLP